MKIFLTILFFSLCFAAQSQTTLPYFLPAPYSTSFYRIGWLKADSGSVLAVRDTTMRPKFAGTQVMWQHAGTDTTLWFWNGIKWVRENNVFTVFAVNGLNLLNDSVRLGGNLDTTTVVNGLGSYSMTFTSFFGGGTLIVNNTGAGFGIKSDAISGVGVFGQSVSGTGVLATSQSGIGLVASSSPVNGNAVVPIVQIERLTTGGAAAGIGGSLDFAAEDNINSLTLTNRLISTMTNVTHGSTSSQFSLTGVNNNIQNTLLTFQGSGAGQLNEYGLGNFTGTPTFTLSVDATGHIIETAVGGGGGNDTIYAKYPLFVPAGVPDTVALNQAGAHQQGFLDSLDWVTFNAKQTAIQWQQGGVNQGFPGQFTTVNLRGNLSASISGTTLNIDALSPTVFQQQLTWRNQDSSILAAAGVVTSVQLDSGLYGTVSGNNLKIFVKFDTVFAGSGLHATGLDTMNLGGFVSANTALEFHNLYSFTLDSLSVGLFITQLSNKASLAGTDSVLINDINGKVFKVPNSALGGNETLQQVFNTEIGGSVLTKIDTILLSGTEQLKLLSTSAARALQINATGNAGGLNVTATYSNDAAITAFSSANAGISSTSSANNIVGANAFTATGTGTPGATIGVFDNTSSNIDVVLTVAKRGGVLSGNGGGIEQDFTSNTSTISSSLNVPLVKQKAIVTDFNNATFTGQYNIAISNGGSFPATDQFILIATGQLRLPNYTTTGSFAGTPVGSLGFDASGNILTMATSSGGKVTTVDSFSTGTSGTISATKGNHVVWIDMASTDSVFNLTMPLNPNDLDEVEVHGGGTLTSGTEVTYFTITANTSDALLPISSGFPSQFLVNDVYRFRYRISTRQWSANY